MVSKNNRQYLIERQAKRCPHYGLRRLSIGVASVLLSTTLYLGMSSTTYAATVTPASTDTPTTEKVIPAAKPTGKVAQESQSKTNALTDTTKQAAAKTTQSVTSTQASPSSESDTASGEQDARTAANTVNVKKAQQQATQLNKQAQATTLKQSLVSVDGNAQLTATDGVTMEPTHPTLSLNLTISNYQNGDTYTISIPKGDLWSGGSVGDNAVTAQGGDGFTVAVQKQADGSYLVTDTFTKASNVAAGITQSISISLQPVDQIQEHGNIAKKITVQKNGHDDCSLTVYEGITPNIIVGSVVRQQPDGQTHGQVLANEETTYWLPVSNSYSDMAAGPKLTNDHLGAMNISINVPQHFQADIQAMKDYFTSAGLAFGDITQSAAGAPIVFTGIKTDGGHNNGFQIIGKYVMAEPSQDTQVTASSSQGTFKFNGGASQNVTVPSWNDTILGSSSTHPVGSQFDGSVTNAYQTTTPEFAANTVPIKGLKTSINTLSVKNISLHNYQNGHFIAHFSTGYAVSGLTFQMSNAIGSQAFPTLTVDYYDGSTENVTSHQGYYNINNHKQLKSIKWVAPFSVDEEYVLMVDGQVANGMSINDKLTAGIGLAMDQDPSSDSWTKTQTIVGEPTGSLAFTQGGEQDKYFRTIADPTDLENNHDGVLTFQSNSYFGNPYTLINPHIYLQLPDTVDPTSAFNSLKNCVEQTNYAFLGTVKMYKRNGKYILEYDGSGTRLTRDQIRAQLNVEYQLKTGLPSMSDTGIWFISADNLVVFNTSNKDLVGTDATPAQVAMLDGAITGKTRSFVTDPVKIETAAKQQNGELAQGNQDPSSISTGTSDDKQGAEMTYVHYVVSEPSNKIPQMTNVVTITNLPQVNTGSHSFGFRLNPNGVEVLNSVTNQAMNGVTILYSTELGNDNNQKTDLSIYKPASQVSDWNQIKSVAVKVPKLVNGAFKILLHGINPTLATDAGKTGILTGQTWCDEIAVPFYNAPDTAAEGSTSKVKVEGQSTIHIKFRYKDANGNRHIIDPTQYADNQADTSVTLTDNSDYLDGRDISNKASELFSTVQANDHAVDLSNYQLLSYSEPQATENSSHGAYANAAPNRQLSVNEVNNGALVQYYMDGDSVIYDLISRDESQRANVWIIDDTPNSPDDAPGFNARGKAGTPIEFDNLQDTLNSYISRGFKVVKTTRRGSDQSLYDGEPADWHQVFGNFDTIADTANDISQEFNIHLVHKTTETTTKKTYHEVVHYRYNDADGNHTDRQAHSDQSPTAITFSQTNTYDEVTHETTDGTWDAPSKMFDPVTSPTISGYTASDAEISNVTVRPGDTDTTIERTVYYTPDAQKAVVHYIDDTANHQVGEKDLNGHSNEHSGYSTTDTINDYENRGYELVSDDTNGQEIVYDTDDNNTQTYYVHLKHKLTPASDSQATFKEIVHYQFKDSTGQPTGNKAADDQSPAEITFTQTGNQKDEVNQTIIPGTWDAPSKMFDPVTSPTIAGYTASDADISNVTVRPGDTDTTIERTVYYTPNAKKQRLFISTMMILITHCPQRP